MNTEFISEWTAELRSGNRRQTEGALLEVKDGVESFCCLGVAMDMLAEQGFCEKKILEPSNGDVFGAFSTEDELDDQTLWENGVLTNEAVAFMGVGMHNPSFSLPRVLHEDKRQGEDGRKDVYHLAELNDSGMTFDQIADVIDYFFKE